MADAADPRPDAPETYRSVSGPAVAAATVGCLSALSIFSAPFLILPLLGVALAVVAIRGIERSEGILVGKLAALAGLGLSVGFGAQGVTARLVTRRITEGRVRQATTAWLEAVREDRLADALGMLAPPIRPVSERLVSGDPQAETVAFGRVPTVAAIRDCGPAAIPEVTFAGHVEGSRETEECWRAGIRLSPCAVGPPVVVEVRLQSEMVRESSGWRERWMITGLDLAARPRSVASD